MEGRRVARARAQPARPAHAAAAGPRRAARGAPRRARRRGAPNTSSCISRAAACSSPISACPGAWSSAAGRRPRRTTSTTMSSSPSMTAPSSASTTRAASASWTIRRARRSPSHPLLAGLGPEPLGNEFNGPVLAARARRQEDADQGGAARPARRRRARQHLCVGEPLLGRHVAAPPRRAPCQGERAERLVAAIRDVLDRAIAAGGSSLARLCPGLGRAWLFPARMGRLRARERALPGLRLQRRDQAHRASRPLDFLLCEAAALNRLADHAPSCRSHSSLPPPSWPPFRSPRRRKRRASFVAGTEDVPLMPGLRNQASTLVVFDKPQGRIVEVEARGKVTRAAAEKFYADEPAAARLGRRRHASLAPRRRGAAARHQGPRRRPARRLQPVPR